MARIAGVDLPRGKRVDIALTYIYGIGRTTAMKILDSTGVNWERSIDDLSADEVNEIRKELEQNYKVEGDLRREVSSNIKRLMDIGCFMVCVIVAVCPCMASARIPMPAPVRDPAAAP